MPLVRKELPSEILVYVVVDFRVLEMCAISSYFVLLRMYSVPIIYTVSPRLALINSW